MNIEQLDEKTNNHKPLFILFSFLQAFYLNERHVSPIIALFDCYTTYSTKCQFLFIIINTTYKDMIYHITQHFRIIR